MYLVVEKLRMEIMLRFFEKPLEEFRAALLLAKTEYILTNKRSSLGRYWETLGLAIRILAIGLIFSLVFASDRADYLPYIATGLVAWQLISQSITESTNSIISGVDVIRGLSMSPMVAVFKKALKNLMFFAQNLLLIPAVYLFFGLNLSSNIVLLIPGLMIVFLASIGLGMVLGPLAARYRDLSSLVKAVIGVAFFVTPVLWQPERIPPDLAHIILGLNPLYHLLQILRLPLLGELPTAENWALSSFAALVLLVAGFATLRIVSRKIAYWL